MDTIASTTDSDSRSIAGTEYEIGGLLDITLSDDTNLTLKILDAFPPFSMSQCLLVQLSGDLKSLPYSTSTSSVQPPPPSRPLASPQWPQKFIAKINDPRYNTNARSNIYITMPWSYESELAAASLRPYPTYRNPSFDPGIDHHPHKDDSIGWEEYYFQNAELQHYSEVTAYTRLACYQGTILPRFLAAGRLILPDRPINPAVILMEYIENCRCLKDISDSDTSGVVDLEVPRSLTEAVKSFASFGVIHNDFNYGNVLISHDGRRGYIIDFGEAILRGNEPDEEWDRVARIHSGVPYFTKMLRKYLGIEKGGKFSLVNLCCLRTTN